MKRTLSMPESFQSRKSPFGTKKANSIPEGLIEDKSLLSKPKMVLRDLERALSF